MPDELADRCPFRWDGGLQCVRPEGHGGVHRDGYKHAGGDEWASPTDSAPTRTRVDNGPDDYWPEGDGS